MVLRETNERVTGVPDVLDFLSHGRLREARVHFVSTLIYDGLPSEWSICDMMSQPHQFGCLLLLTSRTDYAGENGTDDRVEGPVRDKRDEKMYE